MRVLVTGAAGFIGSRLVAELAAEHEVFAVTRRAPPETAAPGIRWLEIDLAREEDYARLPERVDAVVHLAQSRFYKQFPDKASDIFDVNIRGTFLLLEYARRAGVECFIFSSSGGVYGYGYEKFVETDPVSPLNFYLSSKYTAELLIANYKRFFRTVVFRLFFVYGPGQRGMLVPTLVERVRQGEAVVVEGVRGLRVNPIYVDDAVKAFAPALRLQTSELINVAGDEVVTITELVEQIAAAAGTTARVEHTDGEADGDLIGDNSLMKGRLGVSPRTTLAEGLRRTCDEAASG